jgi:hypothetical protein
MLTYGERSYYLPLGELEIGDTRRVSLRPHTLVA